MAEKVADPATIHDPITETFFHKVMLLFNRPVSWPDWAMGLGIVILSLICTGTFLLLGANWRVAGLVGLVQLLFFMSDILLLTLLPRLRISYGPWQGQFFSLAIPRTVVTMLLALFSLAGGWNLDFILVIAAQIVGTCLLVWGAIIEPSRLQMTELDIFIEGSPKRTDPIRILHISDLHIEYLSRREDAILCIMENTQPDLILLTGDYINLSYNHDAEAYGRVGMFLSQLRAPYGIYASLGTLAVDIRESLLPVFDDHQVKLLRNSCTLVTVGERGVLALIGVDCTHDMVRDASVLQHINRDVPLDLPKVLLYHSPELMPQAIDLQIDLYLCGHTHGGQVRLPFIGPIMTGSQLGRRYVMGYYEEEQTQLYISRGVGFEGLSAPRVRLLAPPEITLLRLCINNNYPNY